MKTLAGILAGLVLLLAVFHLIGFSSVALALSEASPIGLLSALGISLSIILLHSYRLKLILRAQKYKPAFWNVAKIHAASNTVNMLTPVVKVGGIPLKVHYLSRSNIPPALSCASVVGEIAIETFSFYFTFAFLLIALLVSNQLPDIYIYLGFLAVLAVIIGAFTSARVLFSQKRLERFTRNFLMKFATVDAKSASKIFNCSVRSFLKDRELCAKVITISFFCRLLEFARIYLVFMALGFQAGLAIVLTVWVVESFLSGIPWLPGGMGLVEGGQFHFWSCSISL